MLTPRSPKAHRPASPWLLRIHYLGVGRCVKTSAGGSGSCGPEGHPKDRRELVPRKEGGVDDGENEVAASLVEGYDYQQHMQLIMESIPPSLRKELTGCSPAHDWDTLDVLDCDSEEADNSCNEGSGSALDDGVGGGWVGPLPAGRQWTPTTQRHPLSPSNPSLPSSSYTSEPSAPATSPPPPSSPPSYASAAPAAHSHSSWDSLDEQLGSRSSGGYISRLKSSRAPRGSRGGWQSPQQDSSGIQPGSMNLQKLESRSPRCHGSPVVSAEAMGVSPHDKKHLLKGRQRSIEDGVEQVVGVPDHRAARGKQRAEELWEKSGRLSSRSTVEQRRGAEAQGQVSRGPVGNEGVDVWIGSMLAGRRNTGRAIDAGEQIQTVRRTPSRQASQLPRASMDAPQALQRRRLFPLTWSSRQKVVKTRNVEQVIGIAAAPLATPAVPACMAQTALTLQDISGASASSVLSGTQVERCQAGSEPATVTRAANAMDIADSLRAASAVDIADSLRAARTESGADSSTASTDPRHEYKASTDRLREYKASPPQEPGGVTPRCAEPYAESSITRNTHAGGVLVVAEDSEGGMPNGRQPQPLHLHAEHGSIGCTYRESTQVTGSADIEDAEASNDSMADGMNREDDWADFSFTGSSGRRGQGKKWGRYVGGPEQAVQQKQRAGAKRSTSQGNTSTPASQILASTSDAMRGELPGSEKSIPEGVLSSDPGNSLDWKLSASEVQKGQAQGGRGKPVHLAVELLNSMFELAGVHVSASQRRGTLTCNKHFVEACSGGCGGRWEKWWCCFPVYPPSAPAVFNLLESAERQRPPPLIPVHLGSTNMQELSHCQNPIQLALQDPPGPVSSTGHAGDSFATVLHAGLEVLLVQETKSIPAAIDWLKDSLCASPTLTSSQHGSASSTGSEQRKALHGSGNGSDNIKFLHSQHDGALGGSCEDRSSRHGVCVQTSTMVGMPGACVPDVAAQQEAASTPPGNPFSHEPDRDCVISMRLIWSVTSSTTTSDIGAICGSMEMGASDSERNSKRARVLTLCSGTRCVVLHLHSSRISAAGSGQCLSSRVKESLGSLLGHHGYAVLTYGWTSEHDEALMHMLDLRSDQIPWFLDVSGIVEFAGCSSMLDAHHAVSNLLGYPLWATTQTSMADQCWENPNMKASKVRVAAIRGLLPGLLFRHLRMQHVQPYRCPWCLRVKIMTSLDAGRTPRCSQCGASHGPF